MLLSRLAVRQRFIGAQAAMLMRKRFCGRGGGGCRIGESAVAGRAHGEGGGGRHLHVNLRRELQSSQFLHLLVQPPVLFRQVLAALLQELAIYLRLLQLRPRSPILEPHLYLPRPQVELFRQCHLQFLHPRSR